MKYIVIVLLAVSLTGCGDIDELVRSAYTLGCAEEVHNNIHTYHNQSEYVGAINICKARANSLNMSTMEHDQ